MKPKTFRRLHKWIGLGFCAFLIAFCVSGIVLNHRNAFSDFGLSRRYLPELFRYKDWNQGLLRGTLRVGDSVFIYGNSGIWSADTLGQKVADANVGLPHGIDHRNIRALAKTGDGQLWAMGQFGLYRRSAPHDAWQSVVLPAGDERYSDLTLRGDSLVVVGRSFLYVARPPYRRFERITLPKAIDDDGRISLFRTVWHLHSGAIFGLPGQLFMDAVAVLLIVLSFTGVLHFLFPHWLKRLRTSSRRRFVARLFGQNLRFHDWMGRKTIVILLFVVLTGWSLRPPLLLALVNLSTPPIPFSTLDSDNPWHDRLRMLRYDDQMGDWLLSTSSGFYAFKDFHELPVPIDNAPPVSVMGLNVFEREADGHWLIGSFNGFYRWQRQMNASADYMTGEPVVRPSRMPFGQLAVGGFSNDFRNVDGTPRPIVVSHYGGTDRLKQPESMRHLPMSLWNVALELHNGRLYTFLIEPSLFYIFLAGILCLLILWTGWKVRRRSRQVGIQN